MLIEDVRRIALDDYGLHERVVALARETLDAIRARDHRRRPRPEWVKAKIAAAQRARARSGAIRRSKSTGRFARR